MAAMQQSLKDIVDLDRYSLDEREFRVNCRRSLTEHGVLVLPGFLLPPAIASIGADGEANQHLAYYTADNHNIYIDDPDPAYPADHPRNREVSSSKGCITTDQIPADSALRKLYDSLAFRDFLCAVFEVDELHEYADSLSSINLHYASDGQELGWHYDNSSFAITLLIQKPDDGGVFEYVKDVRDADAGEMNYEFSGRILDGEVTPERLAMEPGALVLFRGRNSMHRVTPAVGERPRMLVVLAYNTEPGIALSESARMTFFGRLG
jgi:hypothetical protein